MKAMIGWLFVLGATLCLTGCFSIDSAQCKSAGGEHVVVRNYGWKFMNWIPLFSGNASENASMGVALFRNDVTMDKVQKRFIGYANGRAIECPVYNCNDKLTFNLLFIPIPYLFTYNEISISGTMK